MGRHTDSDNLLLLAVLLEFKGVVALIAVDNKQLVPSNCTLLCMGIKVL